jgi:hypothetical protein
LPAAYALLLPLMFKKAISEAEIMYWIIDRKGAMEAFIIIKKQNCVEAKRKYFIHVKPYNIR